MLQSSNSRYCCGMVSKSPIFLQSRLSLPALLPATNMAGSSADKKEFKISGGCVARVSALGLV